MAARAARFRVVAAASLKERGAVSHSVSVTRARARGRARDAADAVLQDLSIYGCRLASPLDHAPGEQLSLRFDGGRAVTASVVWAAQGVIGCRFETPIDHGLLRSLILDV